MQRRIFSLLFLIAGVLLFQSVQAQIIVTLPTDIPPDTAPATYNHNIDVPANPDQSITLTLLPGVIVNSPGGAAVNAANLAGGPFSSGEPVTVAAGGAAVTNIMNSNGANNAGLRIQSAGDAIITSSGKIDLIGTGGDNWRYWT